ncbi:hypothetical protein cypCar_00044723 [Cyprinus carpio]|nr:hypothetical protein cypCar_00044723 [Cyprinus carpio]
MIQLLSLEMESQELQKIQQRKKEVPVTHLTPLKNQRLIVLLTHQTQTVTKAWMKPPAVQIR